MKRFSAMVLLIFLTFSAWAQTYSFGVLPQRSAVLTAQYWNPILDYVGRKSGVTLALATKRTSLEYSEAEARGEFDFVYNNHIFAPSHADASYRVIARMAGKPIHSQIVVPQASAVRSLRELEGREIGFPNKNGFTGYAAPMSALIRAGVPVTPVFGGNQEGVMAQLRAGRIPAAGVNSRVMQEYAAREDFKYRALWTSEPYLDLPVGAHPRVPMPVVKAVRQALTEMASNAEGSKILAASAAVIKQDPPWGFVAAEDAEYQNQREVYRTIWKTEAR
ncbi:MAG: phosphonate transport system substrate-binding protein [Rhodocyclaceae bacterium]|nr:MAG: phosphonate transport system substrate-binding protein [Rhodocyclaceae bacterium]TND01277.1 MAG: phosphonate transport system substrate-binding protein [Rhodocyclaceae bacterium]